MSSIIYKVLFKKKEKNEDLSIDLRFKKISSEDQIKVPGKKIFNLRELTEIHTDFVYIQNIKSILNLKNGTQLKTYKQYLIILMQVKEGDMKGFLLAGNKDGIFIVIGIWPFNIGRNDVSNMNYYNEINNILKKPHLYSKLCLIS